MSDTDWKVIGCRTLIPISVTVRNQETGEMTAVLAFYDHQFDQVFGDHVENVAEAVRDYMRKKQQTLMGGPLVSDPVDSTTWDHIQILSSLVKKSREI